MQIRIVACFILLMLVVVIARADALLPDPQSNGYGPELKSFLELMRHEESELEYQINHSEISRKDYVRSRNRIAIHRQFVLKIVEQTGQDNIPEIHVAAAPEVDQLIENGLRLVRRAQSGDVLLEKWRFLGAATRGEIFYVFERLARK